MSTHSSTMPEFFGSQRTEPILSPTNPFMWSLRREIWEYRSIYLAPAAVAAVFLLGFLVTLLHLPDKVRAVQGIDAMRYREVVAAPYDFIAGLMMLTGILVSVFYCVDALYGERRDRSILFWKSLPVSDLTAVLAKATVPLVVVPLVTFATAIAAQTIMLIVTSVVFLANGLSVGMLWQQISFFQMSMLLLYHLFAAHALWPFPVYCWLLLVSAWARRAVFLWAILPLVAIAGFERLLFHSNQFVMMVATRFIGAAHSTTMEHGDVFPTNPMTHITPFRYLGSPGLWMGLFVAAAFLFAAARLRRDRGPV